MIKYEEQAILEQLTYENLKLQALLELTNAINSNESYDNLIKLFEFVLKEQLGLSKFLLVLFKEDWEMVLKTGVKLRGKDLSTERDLLRFSELTLLDSSPNEVLNEFDCVIPVLHKNQKLAYLLLAFPEKSSGNPERRDISFLQTLTNVLVVALENKKLAKSVIMQIELSKELVVAREMQNFLFPSKLPKNSLMDISGKFRTHREVGGDYYDFFNITENQYAFCIGDVSGKGVSAALLMANFQASVRALTNYNNFGIEELITELNSIVFNNAQGEKFVTFFLGILDLDARVLEYVNAGHNYPILTDGKTAIHLDEGTVGLGMFKELPFLAKKVVNLPKNSTILLYTDGIVELRNHKGEAFEVDRIINIIHAYYPLKTDDLNNLIFSKLEEWREEEDYVDDTAILTCRFF